MNTTGEVERETSSAHVDPVVSSRRNIVRDQSQRTDSQVAPGLVSGARADGKASDEANNREGKNGVEDVSATGPAAQGGVSQIVREDRCKDEN